MKKTVVIHLAACLLSGCVREPMSAPEAMPHHSAGRVVINEVAVNGDLGDWVELYNPGPAITLEEGAWFLTDEPEHDPFLFELPEMELPEGGHVVIWCDKDELTTEGVHAGFRLSRKGADLALVLLNDSGAFETDRVRIDGATPNERSYARVPDGTMKWAMGTATPGSSNGDAFEP